MSSLTINPGGPLKGTVRVPGDKSVTHRAVMLSALADGETLITGYCRGQDCLNTIQAFRAMGIRIDEETDSLTVYGKGRWGLSEPGGPIDCGNSGTGIRLLTGLLAGQDFFTVLTGDESIRRRPMGRVVQPLREMGAVIAGRKGGDLAPLALRGSRLHGVTYRSPVASAQVKSALLLAGLFAEGPTTVAEPRRSRDHTERLFKYLGIPVFQDEASVTVDGRSSLGWGGGKTLSIPGDVSAAAFFVVAASVVPDSEVTILDVGVNPTRTGLIDILREMGADIRLLNQREECGEPVADLCVRSAALHGTQIGPERVPQAIDEFPILTVAAALAEGDTVVTGAEELRVKESDRIATMASELGKMGVSITQRQDGMVIRGIGSGSPGTTSQKLRGGSGSSCGDHRIAMSLAIAGLAADSPTRIDQAECIETSFPAFEDKLLELLTR